MRCLSPVVQLCIALGICGCAQHDLFHPTSVSSGIAASHLIRKVMPVYPAEAKERHVSGSVVLSVLIDEQGNVAEVTPVSGPELLRPAYVDAVRQWRYKPFEQNGVPVPMRSTVTISSASADD